MTPHRITFTHHYQSSSPGRYYATTLECSCGWVQVGNNDRILVRTAQVHFEEVTKLLSVKPAPYKPFLPHVTLHAGEALISASDVFQQAAEAMKTFNIRSTNW